MQRQECPYPQQEIEPRQREKQLGHAHQRLVNPAPVVSGDDSKNASSQKRDQSCGDSCGDRNLAAKQNPRKFVAPAAIGSKEKELAGLSNSEQMQGCFVVTQPLVTRPTHKEANRILLPMVFLIASFVTLGLIATRHTHRC